MSRETVEIVRRVLDAVDRRDTTAVQALYDPEIEMDFSRSPFADFTGQGRYHAASTRNRMAGLWTIRDGRVLRVVWLRTRDDALEAWGCGSSGAAFARGAAAANL